MSELKPCPFCGSEAAEPVFIGNDHTRSRKVTIRCKAPGCTKGMTVGALMHSHEWCHAEAVEKWNARTVDAELAEAKARIAELEKQADILTDLNRDATKAAEIYYRRNVELEKALGRIKQRAEAYIEADAPMQPDSSVMAINDICAAALLKEPTND